MDGVTWITGAGKLTPAAMVIPQRKGVGLSVLPQSKPPGRQGGGGTAGRKQRPESEDGIKGTRTTVPSPASLSWKKKGVGPTAWIAELAPA